ncbi:MAG: porin family protein [bacterium]|nr:porin family protein [bacterium]
MKKLLLPLLLTCLISQNVNAIGKLTNDEEPLYFGLKIGTNYSNVYDESGNEFNADPKFGWAGGAFLSLPFNKFLGFQPELLFSQKGFKATGNLLGNNYSMTRTTSFLDIPLFLALKPTESLTILVGPQYSYLLKQRDVIVNGPFSSAQEQEFKNDNIHKNILCFVGGVDINMEHSVLGLRAGWDVQSNHGDGTSSTPRYKNVWYQATIGFRIN